MSTDKWFYTPELCADIICAGDCDKCVVPIMHGIIPTLHEEDDKEKTMMDNKFYGNVKYLAKKKGIMLGDIEESAGKQRGYLAMRKNRCRQIDLNVAMTCSKMLGVTVNDLVEKDYGGAQMKQDILKKIADLERQLKELDNGQ